MTKPTEFLYVLAGNYQQYQNYVRGSSLDIRYTRYILCPQDLDGLRFNQESELLIKPQGKLSKFLGYPPKVIKVEPTRVNRLVVFGTWRERKDFDEIGMMGYLCGFQLPE